MGEVGFGTKGSNSGSFAELPETRLQKTGVCFLQGLVGLEAGMWQVGLRDLKFSD